MTNNNRNTVLLPLHNAGARMSASGYDVVLLLLLMLLQRVYPHISSRSAPVAASVPAEVRGKVKLNRTRSLGVRQRDRQSARKVIKLWEIIMPASGLAIDRTVCCVVE